MKPDSGYKDNKSQLQEYLQKRGHELPVYEVIKTDGEAHEQTFEVKCFLSSYDLNFFASGGNRKEAEQVTASLALDYLVSKKNKK